MEQQEFIKNILQDYRDKDSAIRGCINFLKDNGYEVAQSNKVKGRQMAELYEEFNISLKAMNRIENAFDVAVKEKNLQGQVRGRAYWCVIELVAELVSISILKSLHHCGPKTIKEIKDFFHEFGYELKQ